MNLLDRLAGAPISWGICEVPGWGVTLPREQVLEEMRDVGLAATELGPDGYLPTDPGELRDLLSQYDLQLVGGFVPLVLHDPSQADAAIATAQRTAALLGAAGATEFVVAMVASSEWAPRFVLDDAGWAHAAQMLTAIEELVGEHGLGQAVHPHLGTMIEQPADIGQILDRTDVDWCLDTGHLLIAGYDPLEFINDARGHIRHVHLKDTVLDLARPVGSGERSIVQGVQDGMFCALGHGDVPIGEVVMSLERSGYDRWYVLEQDVALSSGKTPEGQGPKLDAQMSVEYLRGIDAVLSASLEAT